MSCIRHNCEVWKTADGQTLIEYDGGKTAYVLMNSLNVQHLRDLADAALAAAEAIAMREVGEK